MKNFLRIALKMLAVLLAAAALGTALLIGVFSIPDDRIREHLTESATNRVFTDGLWYEYKIDGQLLTFMDNCVDARFLMSACNWETDTKGVAQRAMEAAWPYFDSNSGNRPLALRAIFGKGIEPDHIYPYARYWHGIQIVMRPLLLLFNYAEIGTLNTLLQALLLGVVCMLLARRGLWRETIAFLVSLACVGAYVFSASLNLSICYYIFLLTSILILWKHEWLLEKDRYLFLFFAVGIVVAYFDTLSWPAVTFGVPVLLYALLTPSSELIGRIKRVVSFGASWLVGYAGFWALKWPISAWITGRDEMGAVRFNVSYHTVGVGAPEDAVPVTLLNAMKKLIYPYNTTIMHILLVVCALLLLVAAVRFCKRVPKGAARKPYLVQILTLAFVCAIPFGWYAVMQNHSIVHNLNFPDRLMLMTLWGGMCIITRLFAGAQQYAPTAQPPSAQPAVSENAAAD